MLAYLLKGLLIAAESSLRPWIYNASPPKVGSYETGIKYGPFTKQSVDIARPQDDPPYPILIWLHGGGFLAGDKSLYKNVSRSYAHHGYLVFNANYRLGPRWKFPAQIQDAARIIHWAVDRAERYGGDPANVFIAGDSAGAYLASFYASAVYRPSLFDLIGITQIAPKEAIRGLLLFYGLYDLKFLMESDFPPVRLLFESLVGKKDKTLDRAYIAEMASPLRQLDVDFPPCFISAGEGDPVFPQSAALVEVLAKKGVAHTSLFFSKTDHPEAGHAFLNFHRKRCAKAAMAASLEFLAERIKR